MSQSLETSIDGRILRRGAYPEFTLPALLVGLVIGVILAVSIAYVTLRLGFSFEGSELAAILGFGVLRGLMGRKSIVENNINQTIASAVNGASSGMMFSIPALYILSQSDEGYLAFNPVFMVLGCIVGAILGVAFIIPLRKQMIDFNRLAYPGGIAVATILKSPGAGMSKAMYLGVAAVVAAVAHVAANAAGIHELPLGHWLGLPDYTNVIMEVSLLTVAVGFLAGKGGVYFVVGGYAAYWLLAPMIDMAGAMPGAAELAAYTEAHPKFGRLPVYEQVPELLRLETFRPLGIGMLIGGALAGIVIAAPLIAGAIKSMQNAGRSKSRRAGDEMSIKLLYVAVVGAFVVLAVIAIQSTAQIGIGRGLLMAVLGTLWIWMAGVILSECIGRTNWSPLSGMTLIGITILLFVASGLGTTEAVVASVMVGAAMCVAMSQATDMMMDLKTGYLVGATPRYQQLGQFAGVWLGPIVVMGLIVVLHQQVGFGTDELPAPQGEALAGVIRGIMGDDVPTQTYMAGAALGALLSASGVGGLGILVGLGFYLPFAIVVTYTIGTILRIVADKTAGAHWSQSVGIPIAAGVLIGDALLGVGGAIVKIFG